jgi:hypothetical protein
MSPGRDRIDTLDATAKVSRTSARQAGAARDLLLVDYPFVGTRRRPGLIAAVTAGSRRAICLRPRRGQSGFEFYRWGCGVGSPSTPLRVAAVRGDLLASAAWALPDGWRVAALARCVTRRAA